MSEPLVSIVIPCYRQAMLLPEAIECALGQRGVSVEVIVVNDGSDDTTEAVAKGYGGRIVYHWQKNGGLSAARNAGIKRATGKYLLFLDADDTLDLDSAKWLTEAAAGREDVLCVMGYRHFETGKVFEGVMPPVTGSLERRLMVGNICPVHAHLCARSMMNRIGGFDTSFKSCEDWEAWVRLVFAGARFVSVQKVGAFYRQHAGTMSKNSLRMARTRLAVLERTMAHLARDGEKVATGAELKATVQAVRRELGKIHQDAAYWSREVGEYGAAFSHFKESARNGGSAAAAVYGMCKLVPHRLMRMKRVQQGTLPATV